MLQLVPEEQQESFDEVALPELEVKLLDLTSTYVKYSMEPMERGYGITVGSPLRRVLLSGIPGTAVTRVKIDGVQHEYSTIPHVKEDVTEILLNVKAIRIHSLTDRPGKLRLEVAGEGRVCAGDILTSTDFEIANPELHLVTLDSPEAKLYMELDVEQGKGYVPASQGKGLPIGVLSVDAIFSPVQRASYTVERIRVGQRTDYERLILEVWTDGSSQPTDVVREAASILVNQLFLFSTRLVPGDGSIGVGIRAPAIPAEHYNTSVEKLDLSPRILNSLKRANIDKVGDVIELGHSGLLKIRNFGEKSMTELFERLDELGMLPQGYAETSQDTPEQDGEEIPQEEQHQDTE